MVRKLSGLQHVCKPAGGDLRGITPGQKDNMANRDLFFKANPGEMTAADCGFCHLLRQETESQPVLHQRQNLI